MNKILNNLFKLPKLPIKEERFDKLLEKEGILIERIISTGQVSPPGFWYNQDQDEWVVLIQGIAELEFEDGKKVRLTKGDYVLCPKNLRHRVTYTSVEPACIWLAVHF